MKKITFLLPAMICLASCIQKEALNSEADILACKVEQEILKREPVVGNDHVTLMVKGHADLLRQSPDFVLSPGATIAPPGGTTLDFRNPQTYVVTSEDRLWSKSYTVSFIKEELPAVYHFEDTICEASNRYYIFAEKSNGAVIMEWASGNPGFALTGSGGAPDDYPTAQSGDGYEGKCVRLTTCSTGAFGVMLGMPIAAGNLFIGTFNLGLAVANPLAATRFGFPFHYVPRSFSGYYRYKAGTGGDRGHAYAVFYETDDRTEILDGTNVLTHPNIISAAEMMIDADADEWTRFDVPFTLRAGKRAEPDKLVNGKYNLAVVFTSSMDGGYFKGAIGSSLFIDEVEVSFDDDTD